MQRLFRSERVPDGGGWLAYDGSELPVYGALTAVEISADHLDVCPGLSFRRTFADIFDAPMLALSPPPTSTAPHPGPWVPVRGGFSFKMRAQLSLSRESLPKEITPHLFLWAVAALMRLRLNAPIQMPILANMPFDTIKVDWATAKAASFESSRIVGAFAKSVGHLTPGDAAWLVAALAKITAYRWGGLFRAFSVYDKSYWAQTFEQSALLIWIALETFFDLGHEQNKTKALTRAICDFLENRAERDQLYPFVRKLYQARGGVTHAAKQISGTDYGGTVWIARSVFLKALEM